MEANRILLANKYARIISCIAMSENISREQAMKLFYESDTVKLLDEGIGDMHCEGEQYLAEEVLIEQNAKEKLTPTSSLAERLLAYQNALKKYTE